MATPSRSMSPTEAPPKGGGKSNLTGFVSKLNNMVNGATDDIVSWVPSGEAFRISDLARLEAETLPQYFRHSRFQSLVRQLNFYNFRKINRERTFWVYYHPLFHRDRPEEMHKLRRRTCPGFDGRRNRTQPGSLPPASANITWSNEDELVIKENVEGEDGGPDMAVSSPGERVKVSRSPSPSNSPMDHLPAGRGSVRSELRGPSLKSVVSEEERSPNGSKQSSRCPSLNNGMYDGMKGFNRSVSEDADLNEYYSALKPPADPLQAEEYVVDQLNHHLGASGFVPITKKSRKAKLTQPAWSDNEDDSSSANPSSRKKYSREEAQERQEQLLAVTEVSRHLDGICADYAASIAAAKPRRSSKARRNMEFGASTTGPAIRNASEAPVFGLEKPYDHYYGPGKCDLLAYDCEDGFTIDVSNDKKEATPRKGPKPQDERPAVAAPPSTCPVVNQSLLQACMEGKLIDSISIFERTIATAILSFCLCTHPKDPELAKKIASHLQNGPMLAKEFEMYCKAMIPGAYVSLGRVASCEEMTRDWKIYAVNFIQRVVSSASYRKKLELFNAKESEAVRRCVEVWFEEV